MKRIVIVLAAVAAASVPVSASAVPHPAHCHAAHHLRCLPGGVVCWPPGHCKAPGKPV